MAVKPFKYIPDGEVLTKFFWARNEVDIIQGPFGCLSADTEFLTPFGWKAISHYSVGDEIAEWNPDTGKIKFDLPAAYINEPCDEMWHFKNAHSLSMVLSDEHRMALYDRHGRFRVRSAADVAAAPGRYTVPVTFGVGDDGLALSDAALRLAVAINADGCFPKRGNQVLICVRKQRKKDRLRVLLKDAGIEWKEHAHSTRETELTFAFCRNGWTKDFGPIFWGASTEQLEVVIDECSFWDGLYGHDETRYFTTNKNDADFIQFAAHATGRRAHIGITDTGREGWKPNYSVQITQIGSPKSKVGIRGDGISIERVKTPNGRKYCFTTPSTGFFVARHNGRIFVTGNSGTSTACMHKLWRISNEQAPDARGVRKSRHLIVRNTFTELKETTLKTWSYWFEEIAQGQFGVLKSTNPPNHLIEWPLRDGTSVRAEFIFVSLDDEKDVQKLLSWEYTTAFFNEMQFNDKAIFDAAHGRAMQGRYPPMLDGGPTYKGILGDMNAPAEGHWVPYMRGDVPMPLEWDDDKRKEYQKPDTWKFHVQPAGLIEVIENKRIVGYEPNPKAENQKWLQEPYTTIIKGKPKSWIDSYVMNRVGLYRQGKPVFESFRPEVHVSQDRLQYRPEWPLIVGLDFARNPAAAICQLIRGQMFVLDEFGMENVSAGTYAPLLKQRIMKSFPTAFKNGIQFWGDPTGGSKGQATDNTPFQIFRSNGMAAAAAPGNNAITIRLEAVETLLNKMVDGAPALLLDPQLRTLKAGMAGAYHFAKIQGQGGRHHETPYKDRFSDYCDALQYACLGAGLGFVALNPSGHASPPKKIPKKKYSLRGRK